MGTQGRVIYRGAEAVLYMGESDGENVIVKERVSKGYRLPEIDRRIISQRTRQEAGLLSRARRAGVLVPKVVDSEKARIMLEWLGDMTVKGMLDRSDNRARMGMYRKMGENIALLHSRGIVHGDLTTANMILKGDEVYFVDFGLGKFSARIEDFASDLFLLYEALKSTHAGLLEEAWGNVLNAYKQRYLRSEEVLKRIEEIKNRRRYR